VAGNISIVHGVTGSSRTFMGEESAGVDAIRVAHARIAAGQSEIALVGGCANADQISTMLLFVMGHRCGAASSSRCGNERRRAADWHPARSARSW